MNVTDWGVVSQMPLSQGGGPGSVPELEVKEHVGLGCDG